MSIREVLPNLIDTIPTPIQGAIMSFIVAMLRVIYDNQETKPVRVLLEASLCGLLSWTAGSAVKALGLDLNWILFMSGVIGYLGSNKVRDIAVRWIDKKVPEDKEKDNDEQE